jgi:hypothetical protein
MSQEKTYKCGFKHCLHENDVSQDEAIKIGNRYMHEDCAVISNNITKIRDIYYEKISNTVVVKQLVSVINALIFTKKIDSSYLLFAINFALTSNILIKSPYGLHYLADNQRIKDAWNKKKSQEIVAKMKVEAEHEIAPSEQVKFKYIATENNGFDSIFNGGN